ncbi:hypothetical protein Barb4_00084 [Bacteroidales bacterium Barb4]|nr:hypothetical protein Barb4_00084 [Bacteroidales bacterium Barb4]
MSSASSTATDLYRALHKFDSPSLRGMLTTELRPLTIELRSLTIQYAVYLLILFVLFLI